MRCSNRSGGSGRGENPGRSNGAGSNEREKCGPMMAKESFWETMSGLIRAPGITGTPEEIRDAITSKAELALEVADLTGHPGAAWAATIPEYLEIISRNGLEPALLVTGMVEKARMLVPVRMEAMTLPDNGQLERWPEGEAAALEITICIAVTECERERIEKRLETSIRVETRGREAEGASILCAGRILAESDRPQTPMHQLMVHGGERLREIYGPARTEMFIHRIIQKKNRQGDPKSARLKDRWGTQLVQRR